MIVIQCVIPATRASPRFGLKSNILIERVRALFDA
jgi:hypothetical protein